LAESVFDKLGGELWLLIPAFAFSVLAGIFVGRVLGVRRSVGASVLSGIFGFVIGVTISLLIASERNNSSEGFARNLFLFALFGAMAAAVWIEFLARPGMMARAQTGLASIPHPLRSLRRRGRRMARYAEITRIAVRNGLGPSLGIGRSDEMSENGAKAPTVRRLRLSLEQCGGMFVKLGQILSTRSDLLSPDAVKELSLLQDHVKPADQASVATLLEGELDAPLDDVFASFDWQPVAAASIGQVYRATLPDGSPVVVKVIRPGIEESVSVDLSVLSELGRVVETRTAWGSDYHVMDLVDEFSDRLREELDFRIEARNAHAIASSLPSGSRVEIPDVYDELSTSRVLVMEWLDGSSVRDVAWGEARAAERTKIADMLLRTFLEQMLQDGVFHADPHPGNVMLLADGRLALIDFGAAGRLDSVQQAALRELMAGVGRRDADAVAQAVLQVASLRRGVDLADFERALARFMAQHLAPGSRPDAAMFNAMLRLFFEFGITLPAEWSTFFRALIVLEGTLSTIAPGYSVIDAAETIAGQWIRSQITPGSVQQAVRDEILRTVPMLRRLPRHVDRAFTMLERDGIRVRVSHFQDEGDTRFVTALVNRAVLAFLAGTIGLLSVGLIAIQGGPPFSGDTSLFRVFGYFGLFCSTVLAMRVIVAVLRDRLN
ncbi:MAG TPA: AarF/UbiB family protein, partial [Acidimicrobiia bacterium]|nr:AarF/UbiB family protein [Acidimicrobiia bacterium]